MTHSPTAALDPRNLKLGPHLRPGPFQTILPHLNLLALFLCHIAARNKVDLHT